MARRSSSSSGGGCLTFIVGLVVIAIVISILPYLLIIAACIFGIWGLVVLFRKINEGTDGTVRRTNTQGGPISDRAYPHDEYIAYEVDRQIKGILTNRLKYGKKALVPRIKLFWYKLPWNKSPEQLERRKGLEEEKSILEGRYYASVYKFSAPQSNEFLILKNVLGTLAKANARVYDSSPLPSRVFVPYQPVGDMKYIYFPEDPICMKFNNDLFCIAPYYIVRFKSNGVYVTTYDCGALEGGLQNGGYNESIKHVTYLHTNRDGSPDRRYKNNPQRVYYTQSPRTVYDMLFLRIAEYHVKYSIDNTLRDRVTSAVRNYAELLPIKSYDPVHHLVRLLNICDDSSNTKKLVRMLDNGDINFTTDKSAVSASDDTMGISKKWTVKNWILLILKVLLGLAVCSLAAIGMLGALNSLTKQAWLHLLWDFTTVGVFALPGYAFMRSAARDYRIYKNPNSIYITSVTHERKLNIILILVTVLLFITSVVMSTFI